MYTDIRASSWCLRREVLICITVVGKVRGYARTPSKRIHSASSPSFKGLDVSETSPIPSLLRGFTWMRGMLGYRQEMVERTRITRVVIPSMDDILDLIRLAYDAHQDSIENVYERSIGDWTHRSRTFAN